MPPELETASRFTVRIQPHDGYWYVAVYEGVYAVPMNRPDAVREAIRHARRLSLQEVAVCDEEGHVIEIVPVPGLGSGLVPRLY